MNYPLRRALVPTATGLLIIAGLAFSACSESDGDEQADTRAVLNAVLALDNAGLHDMDTSVNTDRKIPSSAASTMVELQTVIALTPWPSEFEDDAKALSDTFGHAASLLVAEKPVLADVGEALKAAHDEEHEFSHAVWEWLQDEASVQPAKAHAHSTSTAPTITLVNPSVKFTLGDTAAGYVLVRNAGGAADRILSATANIKATVELHEVVTEGATSRMQRVAGIDVPANGEVELKTGGYHVMLTNVTPPLKIGDEVTITLKLEKAGELSFTAKAEQRAATQGSATGGMDMSGSATPTTGAR